MSQPSLRSSSATANRIRVLPAIALAASLVCSCRPGNKPTPASQTTALPSYPTQSSSEAAAPPTSPSGSSTQELSGPPPLDRTCTTDADCAVMAFEVTGERACCHACATTAGSKRWYIEMQRFCGRHPFWENPHCPSLACPLGPTQAGCKDHRCEAVGWLAVGLEERECMPAILCNAWAGCALIAGNEQNGYFVRAHPTVARGEVASIEQLTREDAGKFKAARLSLPSSPCPSNSARSAQPTPSPGYGCKLQEGDRESPEGLCAAIANKP